MLLNATTYLEGSFLCSHYAARLLST